MEMFPFGMSASFRPKKPFPLLLAESGVLPCRFSFDVSGKEKSN